ncbi:MAG: hypothetical protein ABIJ56_14470 [Pseudomonadota bacterium]
MQTADRLCVFVVLAGIFSACTCGPDVPWAGGCDESGTPGAEGKAVFEFLQTSDDLSEESGNAFCSDTVAHLSVESADSDALPPWTLESSNESVITVDDLMSEGGYPVLLGMQAEGTAEVRVVSPGDGELIDYVELRVKEPEGLGLMAAHPYLLHAMTDERILLPVGTSYCSLHFYPYDGSDTFLYGEYEVVVDSTENIFNFTHHAIGEEGADQILYYGIDVGAMASGSARLTFTGPSGFYTTAEVATVSDGGIEQIELVLLSLGSTSEPRYEGDRGRLVAVQRVSGERLCGGYAVVFESDDPDVVSLSPIAGEDTVLNVADFRFESVGRAMVVARLEDHPSVAASIRFDVEER